MLKRLFHQLLLFFSERAQDNNIKEQTLSKNLRLGKSPRKRQVPRLGKSPRIRQVPRKQTLSKNPAPRRALVGRRIFISVLRYVLKFPFHVGRLGSSRPTWNWNFRAFFFFSGVAIDSFFFANGWLVSTVRFTVMRFSKVCSSILILSLLRLCWYIYNRCIKS